MKLGEKGLKRLQVDAAKMGQNHTFATTSSTAAAGAGPSTSSAGAVHSLCN